MCGDEYGSETARFWEAANFASWKAVQVNGESETKKGPPYLCKNDMSMERHPPVAYFLNLCNMDWRWPTLMDGAEDSWLHKGADPLCGLFKDEVANFTQRKAANALESGAMTDLNCYMCHQSKAGGKVQHGAMSQNTVINNLFHHRGSPVSPSIQNYNFHRACELMKQQC